MTLPNTGDNDGRLARDNAIDYGGLVQETAAAETSAPVTDARPAAAGGDFEAGDLTLAEAQEFFTTLDKAVRARRLYAANNPAYQAFLASFRNTVGALWETGSDDGTGCGCGAGEAESGGSAAMRMERSIANS